MFRLNKIPKNHTPICLSRLLITFTLGRVNARECRSSFLRKTGSHKKPKQGLRPRIAFHILSTIILQTMIFKTILIASFLTIASSCLNVRTYVCPPCGVGKVVGTPDAFGFNVRNDCDDRYDPTTCGVMEYFSRAKDKQECDIFQLAAKLNCSCQRTTSKPTNKPTLKPTSKPTRKPTKNKNKLRRQI